MQCRQLRVCDRDGALPPAGLAWHVGVALAGLGRYLMARAQGGPLASDMPSYAGGLAARIYRSGNSGSYRLRCQLVAGRAWRCASASVRRVGGIDEDLSNANGQVALHIRLRVSGSLDYCATYEGDERWIVVHLVDMDRRCASGRDTARVKGERRGVRDERRCLARVCGEGVWETRRGAKTEERRRVRLDRERRCVAKMVRAAQNRRQ